MTLIARNAHLAAMKEHGLTVRHLWDETVETGSQCRRKIWNLMRKKIETAGGGEKPDVILVCVKGIFPGQHGAVYPEDRKKSTIVIPILNIYGTGSRLQEKLREFL